MDVDIRVVKKGSVFVATAYNLEGNEVESLVAFSESNARRLLREKLGLAKKKQVKKKNKDPYFKRNKSGSVMENLVGVTSARNWKKHK